MADTIRLDQLQVPAALGVSAPERRMRRPVTLDLELEMDLARAGGSDRIGDTVDYFEIYQVVEAVAAQREHRLVEALGQRIADALLERFPFDAVVVTVRKHRPFAGVVEFAGIRIRRERDG